MPKKEPAREVLRAQLHELADQLLNHADREEIASTLRSVGARARGMKLPEGLVTVTLRNLAIDVRRPGHLDRAYFAQLLRSAADSLR